ncbi:N-acetylglucosamine-6-phosphate deacetylase [Vibrio sinensis]|uniref:N-acetylglucosamine-6-phosphate deacetylase n=1 Tax=Vibrio sinensis TaxID=2302434 RepID=A0A3A6R224_9VIBR|nr:N-acetylglucosamine-6-phosphate deacetylase [Vibrio sinensis]RJX75364.1 N-acetylglucosamine-6-phosphate deacetylase [Vibrio sinensis]
MTMKAISASRIFDGEQYHHNCALVWDEQHLISILPLEQLDSDIDCTHYPDALITPGFIDLQVNGGGGVMFNSDTSVESIDRICAAHRQHGTAYLLPTLITATPKKMADALNAAQAAIEHKVRGVLGVHLEGPWLNAGKKGAHDANLFSTPNIEQLQQLPWLKDGEVLVTLAAENVSMEALEWLNQHGIHLSCGHSNAQSNDLTEQKLSTINGFTHLFNAMSPMEGREPGTLGTALMADHAWCSIITDGIHVHPQNVLLSQRLKPTGKLLIITDAMATVGSDTDYFELDGERISIIDNKLVNAAGSLAGAHIGMDQSVANAVLWGIEEAEALRMASTYPAQALKCTDLGVLKRNARAAATILDDQLKTQAVLVDGELFELNHTTI